MNTSHRHVFFAIELTTLNTSTSGPTKFGLIKRETHYPKVQGEVENCEVVMENKTIKAAFD